MYWGIAMMSLPINKIEIRVDKPIANETGTLRNINPRKDNVKIREII